MSIVPAPTDMSKRPLTLILAATPSNGIGRSGQLPWPQHKTDMAYFARVTKHVPPFLASQGALNAVIMGRKTWESIPTRFRPLKGRLNVVISGRENIEGIERDWKEGGVFKAGSLSEALERLGKRREPRVGRVFVIGGASVYKDALGLPQTKKVLLTKICKEYECDTFFPVDLEGEEGKKAGWVRKSVEELRRVTGEEVKERGKEGDVEFEFCLFEKE